MKYDLVSDLHLDINSKFDQKTFKEYGFFPAQSIRNDGSTILVVAGDTHNDPKRACKFFGRASEVYDVVLFVDGNHEHYSNAKKPLSYPKLTEKLLGERTQEFDNVHYLNGTSYQAGSTLFIGANAWYDFKACPDHIPEQACRDHWAAFSNDSRNCRFSDDPAELAREQSEKLRQLVLDAQEQDDIEKIVVITHTVSHPDGLTVKGDFWWDALNGAYANTMMANVFASDHKQKIVHAVFGHTHTRFDFYADDGIRFVSNPRGYFGEHNLTEYKAAQLDTTDIRGKQYSAFGEIDG